MKRHKVGSTKMNEEEFINQFARKWNYKLLKHTRKVLIGWFNIEHMLRVFLRAYNWRKNEKI